MALMGHAIDITKLAVLTGNVVLGWIAGVKALAI